MNTKKERHPIKIIMFPFKEIFSSKRETTIQAKYPMNSTKSPV